MSLDAEGAWQRQLEFIHGFIQWMGSASPGAKVWETSGLSAAIVPAAATRSIPNSAIPESAEALAASYDELALAYREAGVKTWTVWLHEDDSEAKEFLEANGHEFDGAPVAMALELETWEPEDLGDLDWDADASYDELGRINDLAYGYDPPGMAPAMGTPAEDVPLRLYRARVDGEVACVLGMLDSEEDSGVVFVATPPELRGRRLASRLLTAALVEAWQRDMKTSSLQASALGSPIYGRLGYETHFRFHIMERRLDHPA
jgi:GNAT superfamily N-acetyltransferase